MYTLKKFTTVPYGHYTSNFASYAYVTCSGGSYSCARTQTAGYMWLQLKCQWEIGESVEHLIAYCLKCTSSPLKVKSELCWRVLMYHVALAILALRGVLFMLQIPTTVNNSTFRNRESLSLNECVLFIASFPGLPRCSSLVCVQYNTWKRTEKLKRERPGNECVLFPYNLISLFLYQFMKVCSINLNSVLQGTCLLCVSSWGGLQHLMQMWWKQLGSLGCRETRTAETIHNTFKSSP